MGPANMCSNIASYGKSISDPIKFKSTLTASTDDATCDFNNTGRTDKSLSGNCAFYADEPGNFGGAASYLGNP